MKIKKTASGLWLGLGIVAALCLLAFVVLSTPTVRPAPVEEVEDAVDDDAVEEERASPVADQDDDAIDDDDLESEFDDEDEDEDEAKESPVKNMKKPAH